MRPRDNDGNNLGVVGSEREVAQAHGVEFWARLAEELVSRLDPKRVLFVGRGLEPLVSVFVGCGAEVVDSNTATDKISGRFDLIAVMHADEEVNPAEFRETARKWCSCTKAILFFSRPGDFVDSRPAGHQPALFWLKLFGEFSFAPDVDFDCRIASPQAVLLRISDVPPSDEWLSLFCWVRALALRGGERETMTHSELGAPGLIPEGLALQVVGILDGLRAQMQEKDAQLAEQETRLGEKAIALAGLQADLQACENMLNLVLNSKGWRLLSQARSLRERLRKTVRTTGRRLLGRRMPIDAGVYQRWISLGSEQRVAGNEANAEIATFVSLPTISLIMPVYNARPDDLEKAIASVEAQYYRHWELCICDDASTAQHIRTTLEAAARRDPRIKVYFSPQNEGISLASNRAIQLATGDFIGLLDHDDELTRDALFESVKLLQLHPEADVIYSDEDKLEPDGSRSDPFFKPDWSPEFLLSCPYVCHFGVFRRSLVADLGGFRAGLEGSQDYDLMLRVSERTRQIYHIPKILYHWRMAPGSTALRSKAKSYSSAAGQRALEEHLRRRHIAGDVLQVDPSRYRVRPEITGNPLVSIIIPTKDKLRLLRTCVRSINEKTSYANRELVVVDNNSEDARAKAYLSGLGDAVLSYAEPFNFSKIINFAVQRSKGEYLVLLNNDTEVIAGEWLTAMLECLQLPEVGVVGAKLLYPNGTIQHGGVIGGVGGVAGHAYQHFPGDSRGYFDALFRIRNVAAVTAACLMVRRDVFEKVGGFDEDLSVNFNDVDFCLRVLQAGYRVVWTPYAVLRHYESATRAAIVQANEVLHIQRRWGALLMNDPYHNPNLTLERGDYSLRFETKRGDGVRLRG